MYLILKFGNIGSGSEVGARMHKHCVVNQHLAHLATINKSLITPFVFLLLIYKAGALG